MEQAGSKGAAHNATAVAGASSAELEAELTRRAEEYEANSLTREIAGLEASKAKFEASLAQINEKLAAAKAQAKKGKD